MTPLPIDRFVPAIMEGLAGKSLVVVAPPGSGKTTRLPAAIIDSGLLSVEHPKVIVLQPRRIAARAAAARVAEENEVGLWETRSATTSASIAGFPRRLASSSSRKAS